MERSNPVITVLLTHHLDENLGYLNLAMLALTRTKGVPIEVIVLADSETPPEVPDSFTLVHDPKLDNATKKVNFGMKMAHPASKYVFFHSDDVVLSENSLALLAHAIGEGMAIMNPLSNGDLTTRFVAPLVLTTPRHSAFKPIPLHADLEDMNDWHEELITYKTPYDGLIIKQDWVTFAHTLIPKKVFEIVGPLDPALETRHNDQDFCMRAAQQWIPSLIHFGAFAFHFGSKTLKKSVLSGEQEAATTHFHKKWGMQSA